MSADRPRLTIRAAIQSDCQLLWRWVNEPDVRASAFQSESITWREHVAWFRSKIGDTKCRIYIIGTEAGSAVGQVRFDLRDDGTAEVDISIDADYRGRGYGTEALQLACRRLFREASTSAVVARIKANNAASIQAFQKAGFAAVERQAVGRHEAVHMLLPAGTRAKDCFQR
jgi:UDP-2,4-diacetamido-2,4,6-trideoxy-beta-L-altropyranose hydrolase